MSQASDQALYRNVLSSMRDGVLAVGEEGQLLIVNDAAGHLLNLDPAALIDRSLAEALFDEPGLAPLADTVIDAVFAKTEISRTEVAVSVAGVEKWLAVTTHLMPQSEDRQGLVVVITDITGPKRHDELKRLFGQYLDPRIVDQLEGDPETATRGAGRDMTVQFSDLVGFTRLTETLRPEDLIRLINRHLGETARIVRAHGGVVDKFMGDGVMAFWGPPFLDKEQAPVSACAASLDMIEAVGDLQRWAKDELGLQIDPIGLRIGIATGPVVAGSVGSDDARSYTVMGDTVNVAARLEARNKELGTRILINGATADAVGDVYALREMGQIQLRGRQEAVDTFELLGAAAALDGALARRRDLYLQAFDAYRAGDFPRAIQGFAGCLALDARDQGARRMLDMAIEAAEPGSAGATLEGADAGAVGSGMAEAP